MSATKTPQSLRSINGRLYLPDGEIFRLRALLWLAMMVLLLIPMATLLDVSVARWFDGDPISRDLRGGLDLMRVFSDGSGVVLILFAIFLMAPQCRWHLPRLAVMALGAGALATLAKMFALRPRPSGINLDVASMDAAWIWKFDYSLSQIAAFDASTRSFPSGNVATATAIAVGLWFIFPRGRILFAMITCGTALQRMASGAHFPSDVLGGCVAGLLWGYVCLSDRMLGNLFDKMSPSEAHQMPLTVRDWQVESSVAVAGQTPTAETDPGETQTPNHRAA